MPARRCALSHCAPAEVSAATPYALVTTAGPRFRLTVELMDNPCLWRWDIYDPARGGLVESSWSSEWAAYRSAEEAYQAGRERLRTLETRAGA